MSSILKLWHHHRPKSQQRSRCHLAAFVHKVSNDEAWFSTEFSSSSTWLFTSLHLLLYMLVPPSSSSSLSLSSTSKTEAWALGAHQVKSKSKTDWRLSGMTLSFNEEVDLEFSSQVRFLQCTWLRLHLSRCHLLIQPMSRVLSLYAFSSVHKWLKPVGKASSSEIL